MAIENAKMLNVRIKNKYDSYENWAASGLVLEKGEIAIAYTTVDVTIDNGKAKHPALLMKVGNGTDTFANLPWLSAKAADVLAVCKNENDLKDFVSGVIANSKLATAEALATVAGDLDTAEAAIDALEALVGETKVADQISAAITALNLANTYEAKGEAAKVDGKLTEEVTRAKAREDEIAGLVATAQDEVDALEEVVATKAAQADLTALAGKVGDVPEGSTVMGIITNIQENAYDDTELKGLISGLDTNKADKTQVATDIADAVKAEEDARKEAVQGVQDAVDTLSGTHATDKATLEAAIALKADQTALEELAGVAATKAELEAAVEALEGEDDRIEGLVTAEVSRATGEEARIEGLVTAEVSRATGIEAGLRTDVDAIKADYLKAADKTELQGNIDTLTDVVEALRDGVDTDKVDGVLDLIKYVEDHGPEVTGMKEDIAANTKAIEDHVADYEAHVLAQAAVDEAQDAKIKALEDKFTGEGSVEDMIADAKAEAIVEAGKLADAAEADAIAAAATDATNKANAAQQAAEAKAAELADAAQAAAEATAAADATSKANKALEDAKADATSKANTAEANAKADATEKANAAEANAKKYVDDMNIAGTYATKAELNTAKSDLTTEINKKADAETVNAAIALKADQTALDATNAEVAKKANDADLAAIAKTGSTDDLVQGIKVLVFDCGTSAI